MAVKIEKNIVGFNVVRPEAETPVEAEPKVEADVVQHMNENVERTEMLFGSTYKLKTPLSEHALYVTINDMVLNPGTDHEMRRPFEIFINSKNMDHFQWIVALTRIVSAVFRKGGDSTFLVEELKAVFDPRGGYFKKGGKYMPSLVAELGDVIEHHMKLIGMIESDDLDDHQKEFLAAKRAEYDAKTNPTETVSSDDGFPANSQMCSKCNTKAMIQMDNCMTCLNCGESKCG